MRLHENEPKLISTCRQHQDEYGIGTRIEAIAPRSRKIFDNSKRGLM